MEPRNLEQIQVTYCTNESLKKSATSQMLRMLNQSKTFSISYTFSY